MTSHISRKRRQFLIFSVDLLILVSAIPLTLFLRKFHMPTFPNVAEHIITFIPIIAFWEILMYGAALYSLEKPYRGLNITVKLSMAAAVSLLFGFALFYLFLGDGITPKTVLVIYCILGFFLLFAWRLLYNFFFGVRKSRPKIVFVGNNQTVCDLISQFKEFSYLNFEPLAVYDPDPESVHCKNLPFYSNDADFNQLLDSNTVDYCILAAEKEYSLEMRQLLFSMLEQGVVFFSLPDFFELVTRKIPIGSINDTWLLSHLDAAPRFGFDFFKRMFDLVFSSSILLLTAPLWPFIALIIKLESPGPVFFQQIREGRKSKPFNILKFRTMRVAGNSFAPTGTNDNRITPLGNFLRKSRIDEIPQVINVFRGDMSLIGPRPERPELAVELEKAIPYYRQRLIVKPGITGWDQVSGEYHSPSVEDTYKKLQMDLYYIKNRSTMLDLSIFFKTIATVLRRSGR
ncbi:sugar transferase [Treponema zuelzerae]|uniref:Sugar transferase n=1 Tax=Teretinema zuelzerae TaxID=156 RepID=A0AAE3EGR9_9SPIR|nr:sugar transferase [Teretinema zuelzerae]MCD1654665.1 sugar transferase [Teretinema zuelzerae]